MHRLLHHLLPICVTTAIILAGWIILTLPMAAVFIIDKAFVVQDYVQFILYAGATAFGFTAGILFPLALLLERCSRRMRAVAFIAPVALILLALVWLLFRLFWSQDFLGTFIGQEGLLLAVTVVFGVYWTVLWVGRSFLDGVWSFGKKVPPDPTRRRHS